MVDIKHTNIVTKGENSRTEEEFPTLKTGYQKKEGIEKSLKMLIASFFYKESESNFKISSKR